MQITQLSTGSLELLDVPQMTQLSGNRSGSRSEVDLPHQPLQYLAHYWTGQMFEISILGVILVAIGYCATLWIMGRRDDVIYGQFVETEPLPAVEVEPPLAPARSDLLLESLLRVIKNAAYG
jgi:hypothetical protein